MSEDNIDQSVIDEAERIMSDVKARILLKQPFYGVLLSQAAFVCERQIPTMATDGKNIYYNPKFVVATDKSHRPGILMHEIGHCIYLHCSPERRLNRDKQRWNVAADFVINLEISEMNYPLPKDALLDTQYRNMNAEQVYDALPKDVSQYKTMDTHIDIADGNIDWDEMQDKVIAAYEMTKDYQGQGKLPAGVARWVDKIRKSKVKWERVFHRYVGQALAKDDYSYTRCNRRLLGQNIYLPDLRNHVIGNVVLAIDTSGSITREIVEQFTAELSKISHLVEEVTVMTCDATVHEVVKVRKMEYFFDKIQMKGGGGTDFRPVFKKVEEVASIPPDLLIYLTDAWGSFPEKKPPYPVLWCLTETGNMHNIKFGEIVELPKEISGRR